MTNNETSKTNENFKNTIKKINIDLKNYDFINPNEENFKLIKTVKKLSHLREKIEKIKEEKNNNIPEEKTFPIPNSPILDTKEQILDSDELRVPEMDFISDIAIYSKRYEKNVKKSQEAQKFIDSWDDPQSFMNFIIKNKSQVNFNTANKAELTALFEDFIIKNNITELIDDTNNSNGTNSVENGLKNQFSAFKVYLKNILASDQLSHIKKESIYDEILKIKEGLKKQSVNKVKLPSVLEELNRILKVITKETKETKETKNK